MAGPIAAAVLDVPSVGHGWGSRLRSEASLRARGEVLAPLWRRAGLEPAPYGGLFRCLFLDPCPPSLQDPHAGTLGVTHPLRPDPSDAAGGEALPAWVAALPARPTVCASLGTVPRFSHAPDLWAAILAALAPEPVNVVLTVGPRLDPTALGPLPANARAARYIPLSLLVPRCDVVITHGGAGTVLAALSHGVPLLVLPRGAPSQRAAAESCVAAGVARAVADAEPTAETIRREVRVLLDEPRYRARARQVQEEIGRMPSLHEGVALLERLVAAHRTQANDRTTSPSSA